MGRNTAEWGLAAVAAGFFLAIVAALGGVMVPEGLVVILLVAAVCGSGAWGLFREFKRDRKDRARRNAISAKKEREAAVTRVRQGRIEKLGAKNTALLEAVENAVDRVVASEAARAGWLGDVDFSADIAGITESLKKSHALRKLADQLSALDQPTADDRKILAEAQSTIANLERKATDQIALIHRCAGEAKLVDESLRQEREDAKNVEQKAELHAKLSSMLYGIESLPTTKSANSSADAVIARVQAYREIKSLVQDFR